MGDKRNTKASGEGMKQHDYRSTLQLPTTGFPIKAAFREKEEELLAYWKGLGLEEAFFTSKEGEGVFLLHDGPPYANGHLHMGHGLNKILKDMTCRFRHGFGEAVNFRPGWDCHGLPIEWKIEETLREEGKKKESLGVLAFRAQCREFAQKWIKIQKSEFKRLGILSCWDEAYTTMDKRSESIIVREFLNFLEEGRLYRKRSIVYWSVVEETSLAEAEVEYREKESRTVYVLFDVTGEEDMSLLVWTTTPWTLPCNQAIAYNPDLSYGLYESDSVGKKLVIGQALVEGIERLKGESLRFVKEIPVEELRSLRYAHPLPGYRKENPLLASDFVTAHQGTGLVHLAPDHGVEDFALGQREGLDSLNYVGEGGVFTNEVPLFRGLHIFKSEEAVIEAFQKASCYYNASTFRHEYPHSWRSKAPLIYRSSEQWFLSMERLGLREKALEALEGVSFFPSRGKRRLEATVRDRPDWLLSRQRLWGVPCALFVHKETGKPLVDKEVNRRIVEFFAQHGSDVWWERGEELLGSTYALSDYEQVFDILDVWFDSGVSHCFGLLSCDSVADLYLEGSDQHRGWFQSSLLHGCGSGGKSPYRAVMTHGFIVDGDGKKFSKSQGKGRGLMELIDRYGCDVLRLWVGSSDCSEDLKYSAESFATAQDMYRKFRNCLRFCLGNLRREEGEVFSLPLPSLERYILSRLFVLDEALRSEVRTFRYHVVVKKLFDFVTFLSTFYFDIRKDVLYCAPRDSAERLASVYILRQVLKYVTVWLGPFLPFTAEEAYLEGGGSGSSHLESFPVVPSCWYEEEIEKMYKEFEPVRVAVQKELEVAREEKEIGSSLEAHVELAVEESRFGQFSLEELEVEFEALFIVSKVGVKFSSCEGFGEIKVKKAWGERCGRCWKVGEWSTLCDRCTKIVRACKR